MIRRLLKNALKSARRKNKEVMKIKKDEKKAPTELQNALEMLEKEIQDLISSYKAVSGCYVPIRCRPAFTIELKEKHGEQKEGHSWKGLQPIPEYYDITVDNCYKINIGYTNRKSFFFNQIDTIGEIRLKLSFVPENLSFKNFFKEDKPIVIESKPNTTLFIFE